MAGRPVSLHGGSSGMLYGLIAFAGISVISLGLFVFQLTKNKAAENRAQGAEQRIQLYGTPPSYYADEARSRKSNVFGVMNDDLRKLAGLVTGAPDDVGAAVQAKAQRVLGDIARTKPGTISTGDALLTALMTMSERYGREQATGRELGAQVQELRNQNAALTQQLKATRDEFEAQVARLSEQVRLAQEEKISAVAKKDSQLQQLQATLDATEAQLQSMRREGNTIVREKDIELGRREALISELQKQVQALKPGAFDPTAVLTSADGRIARAIPGSDLAYITLGAADRIKPGMGFEVYSPARESGGGLRGKASLEVVTVMEQTSECRVTRRVAGQPIIEGDVIVNIAYDRGRKPKFVVRGDFDLDYDGNTDFNGLEEIAALIRQWGGQVVEELDESVDFVVIGLPPTGPEIAADQRVSAVVRDQAVQKELERSKYRALVERAQKMFIPVVTQNQFLFLTGYAGDAVVVRR